jgi:hypothetical protein
MLVSYFFCTFGIVIVSSYVIVGIVLALEDDDKLLLLLKLFDPIGIVFVPSVRVPIGAIKS